MMINVLCTVMIINVLCMVMMIMYCVWFVVSIEIFELLHEMMGLIL